MTMDFQKWKDEHPEFESWVSADAGALIIQADCASALPTLPESSIGLIVNDPPYHRVKSSEHEWDWQWKTDADYLAWIGGLCEQFQRVMRPNGSLYLFASPEMAWGVEGEVRRRFNVLTTVRWYKTNGNRNWSADKESLRAFPPNTETIIFAEHQGAELVRLFSDYIESEQLESGASRRDIAELFPSSTGGLTGCYRNWLLGYNIPSKEQYEAIRGLLNKSGGDFLRREYEHLRAEYEHLRRPFNVTADDQYTDVWNYPPVATYSGKHVCEKPHQLLTDIMRISGRSDFVVLDATCGSGSTLIAAREAGMQAIGIESDLTWYAKARRNVARGRTYEQSVVRQPASMAGQKELFAESQLRKCR